MAKKKKPTLKEEFEKQEINKKEIARRNRNRGKQHQKITAQDFNALDVGIKGREDVYHHKFCIECKSRVSFAGEKWWKEADKYAVEEGKGRIPLAVVHIKGRKYSEDYIIIRKDHFLKLCEEIL